VVRDRDRDRDRDRVRGRGRGRGRGMVRIAALGTALAKVRINGRVQSVLNLWLGFGLG
jgi:hypothetical protein